MVFGDALIPLRMARDVPGAMMGQVTICEVAIRGVTRGVTMGQMTAGEVTPHVLMMGANVMGMRDVPHTVIRSRRG